MSDPTVVTQNQLVTVTEDVVKQVVTAGEQGPRGPVGPPGNINFTVSTADPSGGVDGDVWLKYYP